MHFPALQAQKPATISEYAGKIEELLWAFGERFQDVKRKQQELNAFATLFHVEPSDVPDSLQTQKSQSCDATTGSKLLDFYKLYVSAEDFPILRRLKFALGSTAVSFCFSTLTQAKTRLHSRLQPAKPAAIIMYNLRMVL